MLASTSRLLVRMTPSEAFVETLNAHRVHRVYGIAGSAFMDALDLFPKAGIKFISTQHEQAAVWMAEAESRLSGHVGVCIAQNGPGVLNFVNALQGAFWNHTPLVAFTPDHATTQTGLGGFQEAKQLEIFRPIVKAQFEVRHPKRMSEVVSQAFRVAATSRGPVQVNIPRDMWQGEFDFDVRQSLPIVPRSPHRYQVDGVVELLSKSSRPVLILGAGVVQGRAVAEAVALAEKLEIPVATTYLHNDAFPSGHRLSLGVLGYNGSKAAMDVVSKADLLLCVGTRLNPYLMNPQYGMDWWPRQAKKVQVDVDESRLGLTCPVDVGISSDARDFINALLQDAGNVNREPAQVANHLTDVQETKASWRTQLDKLTASSVSEGRGVPPRRALREIEEVLKNEDPIICLDTGNLAALSASYLGFFRGTAPGLLGCGMWASCGPAVSYAIGAGFHERERSIRRPIVAITGEGSFMMAGINELLTAVREKIPIVVVVLTNQMWGAEAVNQQWFFGNRKIGTTFAYNPNYAEVARALGAEGFRCNTPEDVRNAMASALKKQSSGVVSVVEVLCTEELGEPFRRDAMKTPQRVLDKYK